MKHWSCSIAPESEGRNKELQGLNLSSRRPVEEIAAKRRRKGIPQRAPTGGLTIERVEFY